MTVTETIGAAAEKDVGAMRALRAERAERRRLAKEVRALRAIVEAAPPEKGHTPEVVRLRARCARLADQVKQLETKAATVDGWRGRALRAEAALAETRVAATADPF